MTGLGLGCGSFAFFVALDLKQIAVRGLKGHEPRKA